MSNHQTSQAYTDTAVNLKTHEPRGTPGQRDRFGRDFQWPRSKASKSGDM